MGLRTGLAGLSPQPARRMRWHAGPPVDRDRLRWYRDETWLYRLLAGYVVPGVLRLGANIVVEGLEHVPASGPVIFAANHRDNWDGYVISYVAPRRIYFAARPDGFGTGPLCAYWRQLGAFPADAWGVRYGLSLLGEGRALGIFPQGRIARELGRPSSVVGLLALRSGAPVVPVAILGTEAIHIPPAFGRPRVRVRFGAPKRFGPGDARAPHCRAVAEETLGLIRALLADMASSAGPEVGREPERRPDERVAAASTIVRPHP